MTRGIDHIVHVVHDLDAAQACYERLGFQVGLENAHPWGTRNRLVLVPGSYIELLSIPASAKLPAVSPGVYSFGAFNRDFLRDCGEGLSSLALQSDDPAADKRVFDQAGFGGYAVMDFSRQGRRPDGGAIGVSFSLAFARDPESSHACFFTCLQRTPQQIWFPESQQHGNGAGKIAAIVCTAENPTDHHIFMGTFAGTRAIRATSLGLNIEAPRSEILVYAPQAFSDIFGTEAPKGQGMRVAAVVFKVKNLAVTKRCLTGNGLKPRSLHNRLVLGPAGTAGAVIAFEAG